MIGTYAFEAISTSARKYLNQEKAGRKKEKQLAVVVAQHAAHTTQTRSLYTGEEGAAAGKHTGESANIIGFVSSIAALRGGAASEREPTHPVDRASAAPTRCTLHAAKFARRAAPTDKTQPFLPCANDRIQ